MITNTALSKEFMEDVVTNNRGDKSLTDLIYTETIKGDIVSIELRIRNEKEEIFTIDGMADDLHYARFCFLNFLVRVVAGTLTTNKNCV